MNLEPMNGRRADARRGRPRRDEPPRYYRRNVAAQLAGVSERTISRACNLWESSGGRYGLAYAARRGPVLLIAAPALLAWVANGCQTGRHQADVARSKLKPQHETDNDMSTQEDK